jgi:hypothetical protein
MVPRHGETVEREAAISEHLHALHAESDAFESRRTGRDPVSTDPFAEITRGNNG